MRVLHVVTLVTPDGAFGGPVRVAVNHVRELRRRGHDAVVVAAASGFPGQLPDHVEDVPARLFPARRVAQLGFSGLVAPRMLAWLRRELRTADVVHIHLARDLITLPVALLAQHRGVRYVVQPHGMIDASSKKLATVLDAVGTRRALRQAQATFYLTPRERDDLCGLAGETLRLVELRNGTPEVPLVPPPAQPNVLFMARLQARKRPTTFVHMARLMLDARADATFSLVGPDEGELAAVLATIRASGYANRIRYEGVLPPEQTAARLDAASIMVLPSVDEPFPMAVLEALAHGRPVVVTDSCGLADRITGSGAGVVTDGSAQELADAARQLLARGHEASLSARLLATTAFGMTAAVDEWLRVSDPSQAEVPAGK